MKGRKIALSALLAALAVVILYIPAVIPSVKISMAAVAGLLAAVALIELGRGASVMVFAASAALALLIVPVKSPAVLYAGFFGYYPIAKSLAEMPRSRVVEWVIKLALFNIVLFAALKLGLVVVGDIPWLMGKAQYVITLAANLVFVVYDACMTRLIGFYMARISPKVGSKH